MWDPYKGQMQPQTNKHGMKECSKEFLKTAQQKNPHAQLEAETIKNKFHILYSTKSHTIFVIKVVFDRIKPT